MSASSKPLYLGVVGKPVLQSLSPTIHKCALDLLNLKGTYLRLATDSFAETTELCQTMGISGINITAPYKEKFARSSVEKGRKRFKNWRD